MASFRPIEGFSTLSQHKEGSNSTSSSLLSWYYPPPPKSTNDNENPTESKKGWWQIPDENTLLLAPPAKQDYWRNTYYDPLLIKDDAPFLHATISKSHLPITVQTSFELLPTSQFDQCGIMIRLGPTNWLKTGIEVVDEIPRLSCVVTKNGYSDWSTQSYPVPCLEIRVHCLERNSKLTFVIEANTSLTSSGDAKWSMIRICHLEENNESGSDCCVAPLNFVLVGLFGACPVDQTGAVAKFTKFSICQGSSFFHTAT